MRGAAPVSGLPLRIATGLTARVCRGSSSGKSVAMLIPGVHVETVHDPVRYAYAQIEQACAIARMLNRGRFVLVEPPRR